MAKKVLVLGETREGALRNVSFEAIAAAKKISGGGEVVGVLECPEGGVGDKRQQDRDGDGGLDPPLVDPQGPDADGGTTLAGNAGRRLAGQCGRAHCDADLLDLVRRRAGPAGKP